MTFIWPLTPVSVVGGATEATALQQLSELQDINTNTSGLTDVASATKQDAQTTELQSINSELDAQTTELQSINSELDTQTAELTSIDSKIVAVDTGDVTVTSSVLPTGAATEASLAAVQSVLSARLSGSLAPVAYDEIVQTYVGATTDLDTVVYKLASVTVKTLTFSYDGNGRLIGVVAS